MGGGKGGGCIPRLSKGVCPDSTDKKCSLSPLNRRLPLTTIKALILREHTEHFFLIRQSPFPLGREGKGKTGTSGGGRRPVSDVCGVWGPFGVTVAHLEPYVCVARKDFDQRCSECMHVGGSKACAVP